MSLYVDADSGDSATSLGLAEVLVSMRFRSLTAAAGYLNCVLEEEGHEPITPQILINWAETILEAHKTLEEFKNETDGQ